MNEHIKQAWVAGEASGDFIASLIVPEVQRVCPQAQLVGVAGPKMQACGVQAWYPSDVLSVRGYVEVIKHLPQILRVRKDVKARLLQENIDTFVGVDAPDFNLDVALFARRHGKRAIQVVSPSIWAWRPERIETIRRSVDHVLTIFPFEKAIYDKAGVPATYIGHPLAGIIPMEPDVQGARLALGLDPDKPVVGVLPGSRIDELKGCAGVFFESVERLLVEIPDLNVVVPAMSEASKGDLVLLAKRYPRLQKVLTVVVGQSHRVIEASSIVLVASGTAALECALYKKPMVVGYKMPMLTGYLMEKKALIRCVSLPNILLGEMVVPECLQYFCTPGVIAPLLKEVLTNTAQQRQLVERFSRMHESLLRDTGALAAEVICHG